MKKKVFGGKSILLIVGFVSAALILWGSPAIAEEKIEGPLHVESWGGSYGEAVKNIITEQ